MKKLIASSLSEILLTAFSPYLSTLNHLFPVTVRYVHGGCAIIKSHFSLSKGVTSCFKCHSGRPPLQSRMSQEYASCPNTRNALQTVWLSSQAINTFNLFIFFMMINEKSNGFSCVIMLIKIMSAVFFPRIRVCTLCRSIPCLARSRCSGVSP